MKDLIKKMESIARKHPVQLVIAEGWDERCLQASAEVLAEGLANITLLGEAKKIQKKAKELGVDIHQATIVDYKHYPQMDELVAQLLEVRKHKGLIEAQARKLLEDENYFACTYTLCGHADGICGSAICPTASLMRPVLQILRKQETIVSEIGVFHDTKNKRIIFASDISLNIDPSPQELAQIALNAAHAVRGIGVTPKVALLSFSTKGSGGDGPALQVIREALRIAKEKDSNLLIDGEIQVDAAVSKFGCQRKCPDSPLKGEANVLIFPNLTAGNIWAHSMGQFSDMSIEFSLVEGLQKPVSILGRSTPLRSVRNLMVSCAMHVNADRK
ncbi:hypothetical protein HYW21_05325 [Candidatus Woesearchaeota archaeon]|nr:hypothetical protein [Candidatus Woesearchaeota archaeon]